MGGILPAEDLHLVDRHEFQLLLQLLQSSREVDLDLVFVLEFDDPASLSIHFLHLRL